MMWQVFYLCADHADQHLVFAFVGIIVLIEALVIFFTSSYRIMLVTRHSRDIY